MVCSIMETGVTFIMAFNFHTSSLDNLVAFTDEEIEAEGSLELAKVLQIVCEEAETGAPVLDAYESSLLHSTV